MEKINFINNQAPALNATNLNQLQTNIENEFTDSNEFKNLYSNNYLVLANLTYSNGTFTQTSADTRTDLQWELQAFNDSTFIKQLNSKTNNSLIRQSINFTKDSSFNAINFGLNGTSNDTTLKIDVSNLENDKTYTLSWNLLNNVQGSIAWNEVQIEEGTSMTSYKNYAGVIVESGSNDNGSWIKYSDGNMICRKTTGEISMSITTPWGSLYESNVSLGNFPAEFIETPTISVTPFGSGMLIEQGGIDASKTSWGNATCVRPNSVENVKARFHLMAIGKWK